MKQRRIVLIIHDVRSAHNVGSLLRTADSLDIERVYFSGYTPYPEAPVDERLPHIRARVTNQIHKTALGAEDTIKWQHEADIYTLLNRLKRQGFLIAALEQSPTSVKLNTFSPPERVALVVGSEVQGLSLEVLEQADKIVEIPMLGKKESLNVAVAAGIALYHLRYQV
jgi:tRNA G18 (ribose-2'-O)-methylase SpoU